MRTYALIVASTIHAALRLAYFFYIGFTLRARHSQGTSLSEDSYGVWLSFKKKASFILNADGLTLAMVAVLSAGSLPIRASFTWTLVFGVVLTLIGVGVKVAAYRVVGIKGYYWYNFFCRDGEREYVARGIYQYLDNPMYTLGYLHAFGFALIFRSMWGLVFAGFDVLVLWAFHLCFERPHTRFYRQEMPRFEAGTNEGDSLGQEEYN